MFENKFDLYKSLYSDNALGGNSNSYENLQLTEEDKIKRRKFFQQNGLFGRSLFRTTAVNGILKL